MIRIVAGVGIALLVIVGVGVRTLGPVLRAPREAANKETAVAIVRDLSRAWNIRDIEGRLTQHALDAMASNSGKSAIQTMSGVGHLINAHDVVQTKITISNVSGTIATIRFRGEFKNATTPVTIVLELAAEQMKLLSLSLHEVKVG